MSLLLRTGYARIKPPVGTAINRADPLAFGLTDAWILNNQSVGLLDNPADQSRVMYSNGTNLPWPSAGPLGKAVRGITASSQHYKTIGNVRDFKPPFSILALQKPTANAANKPVLSYQTGATNSGFRFGTESGASGIVILTFGGVANYRFTTLVPSTTSWSWVGITVDRNGGTAVAYMGPASGGQLLTQSMAVGTMSTGLNTLRVAGSSDGSLEGELSHVFFWNRRLSSTEMRQMVANPFRVFQTQLRSNNFVAPGPTITVNPSNTSADAPATANFSVTATTSGGVLTYQWQDNRTGAFTNVSGGSGGTSASYTTAATTEAFQGRAYRCIVTDDNGSATSTNATLTLTGIPAITGGTANPVHLSTGNTVTGTDFEAAQGTGGLVIGGSAQTETAWGDTSATYTADRGTNLNNVAVNAVLTKDGGVTGNSYALTGFQQPAGYEYVTLTSVNSTADYRITAIADLAIGNQLEWDNALVTINADGTYVADPSVTEFNVRVGVTTDGWGSLALQTVGSANDSDTAMNGRAMGLGLKLGRVVYA